MKYRRYTRDAIVAVVSDGGEGVVLQRSNGVGLLRTREGTPQVVVDRSDFAALSAIFECLALDLEQTGCVKLGVEVES